MAMNRQYTGIERPLPAAGKSIGTLYKIYQAYKAGKSDAGAVSEGGDAPTPDAPTPDVAPTSDIVGQVDQGGVPGRGDTGLRPPAIAEPKTALPERKGLGYYAKEIGEEYLPGRYQPATRIGLVDPKLHDPAPSHIVAGLIGNYFSMGLAGRTMPYKTFGVQQAKFGAGPK